MLKNMRIGLAALHRFRGWCSPDDATTSSPSTTWAGIRPTGGHGEANGSTPGRVRPRRRREGRGGRRPLPGPSPCTDARGGHAPTGVVIVWAGPDATPISRAAAYRPLNQALQVADRPRRRHLKPRGRGCRARTRSGSCADRCSPWGGGGGGPRGGLRAQRGVRDFSDTWRSGRPATLGPRRTT
jgi:hypothetical protein